MSWLGWLLLLAGLYVLVIVVRGLVQFTFWLIEEWIVEPRALRELKEKPADQPCLKHRMPPPTPAETTEQKPAARETKKTPRPVRPNWWRPWRSTNWPAAFRKLSLRRGYDYWVACALAEDDRRLRAEYLSKALQANPEYPPAWGMKGHALFELGQYDEAIACFDKSLALHPSALAWYRRGLCFEKKGELSEALRCFGKALAECGASDRPLMEEITRMKKHVEERLGCVQAR